MDARIEKIEDTQKEILESIKKLTEEIQKLQVICGRMDGHISFVESTYEKFKHPLNVIKHGVENFFVRTIES